MPSISWLRATWSYHWTDSTRCSSGKVWTCFSGVSKVFFASSRNFLDEVKKSQVPHAQLRVKLTLSTPFVAVHSTDQLSSNPLFRNMPGKRERARQEFRKNLHSQSTLSLMEMWKLGYKKKEKYFFRSAPLRNTITPKKRKENTGGATKP